MEGARFGERFSFWLFRFARCRFSMLGCAVPMRATNAASFVGCREAATVSAKGEGSPAARVSAIIAPTIGVEPIMTAGRGAD